MREADGEFDAVALRVGRWLPPAKPVSPGAAPVTPARRPIPAARVGPAVRTARTRIYRRVARRRAARSQWAVLLAVVIMATGLAVAVSRSDTGVPVARSPAPVTELWPMPATGAAGPSPIVTSVPTPTTASSATSTTASRAPAAPQQAPAASGRADRPPRSVPPPARRVPVRVSYEAERNGNVMGGQTRPLPRSAASGGYVARFVGNGSANFLRFTGVTVPDSDTYDVRIQYIAGERRQASIVVDGRTFGRIDFPTTPDWYTVGAITIRLPLHAGAHTIEFGNPQDWAPDFDRIDVARG